MKALVSIRHERPPHGVVADLPNAFNVDRLLTRRGKGAFAFDVPTPGLHRDIIYEGRIVVIESTEDILPYVGVVTQTREDAGSRTVEVAGDNYASVLYGMAIDRSAPSSNMSGGTIAGELLNRAQSMGRSVFVQLGRATGSPLLLQGSIDFGAQLLGAALDGLAARLNDEWWLEHLVTRRDIKHYLYWDRERGVDRPDILLLEGVDFSVSEYKRDALGRVRSAIAVGGGGPAGSRPSVAVAGAPGSATSKAQAVNALPGAIATVVGNPLIERDIMELRPLDGDRTTLADAARRAYERPTTAAEALALTVTSTAWSRLRPGDTVRARFHSINYGGLYRAIRINAMQPDETSGECDLDVEVAA